MTNKIEIRSHSVRFDAAPELYGLFFEDINHAADGGLYPEMLRNRAFEDSLVPDGCIVDENHIIYMNDGDWPGAFNHGEGMDEWAAAVPETSVPAWYAKNAVFTLENMDTLNANRKAALKVHFQPGGSIWNIGYFGVPVKKEEGYLFNCFLKSDRDCVLTAALTGANGTVCYGTTQITVTASETYNRYDVKLVASDTDFDGNFRLSCDREADIVLGFTSLFPEKTFCGHGLREDLALMLKNTHSAFIRYPGGCVVEGINEENTLAFHKTIGPVHERPSCQLMWHYRTTNGFGFHEYLQLCEDLGMDAMYVVNCGISCQARHGHGFSEEKTKEYLQEALNALEYALGPEDSTYGKMRADAGHPAPFPLKYIEIGNENNGPVYYERYEMFYHVLKDAYPQVIYISNSHTEREGLPTEVVDEHYYSTPEFFQESGNLFDEYDRKGPKIFLGEYAVNGGNTIASMECALGEAVFLTGAEKNQDIIRMTAYAPLLQNNDYTAWKPNLIVFDNHQVYGIPSYHVISLFGEYRGEKVVEIKNESELKPPIFFGIPGIQCEKDGMLFRNPRIDGKPVEVSKEIYGELEVYNEQVCEEDESNADNTSVVYRMIRGQKRHHYTGKSPEWNTAFEKFREAGMLRGQPCSWVTFGTEEAEEMTFEIDVKFDRDNPVTFTVWNHGQETDVGCNEPKDPEWDVYSVRNQKWKVADGVSVCRIPWLYDPPLSPEEIVPVELDYDAFHHFEIRCNHYGYSCYIDGRLIQEQKHTLHPVISTSCETTEEEIILKLVNVEGEEKEVTISLDCEIAREIHTETVQAPPDCVNSFEHPLAVSAVSGSTDCGAKEFVYHVPAYSVSVLVMKKIK